ncbi:MAG: DEAD/DEAH box helicase family protein [Nitrosopumilaceae archaeon]|nr:DEAD/DEAH box helicase [Nitrosopumilaceae archaeon]NIU00960.1 DEAD/DEAH box helicase [Nitrosopumilaceae archaeon]NIU87418.1 DEAD/DEAH box helicase family protein [Nitrosopumilaceae archaeon]NIV65940.1 DEAD/DEAH box helicase family protein [Nitrosopumilaceae archaeon]NIX61562.1 DEAD/DEAH box helicase family protein [Nitrosopumilaceae archaeon]
MKNFGTLEYVLDKYSKTWTWKIAGPRAVNMVSRLIPEAWYGEKVDEVIVPDSTDNVRQIKWMVDQYPVEVLSKSAWQRKIIKTLRVSREPTPKEIHKLQKAKAGEQFRGELLDFQKEGLDFLVKSYGNALLADEMGLGKTVQTLAYMATERQSLPVLVVAPLVTLNNWQREINKFMKKKSRNGRIIDDNSPSSVIIRTGKREEIGNYDFYIINYELLHKRLRDLSKLNIKTIVCDEVHNLRSKTTQKYRAVKKLSALSSVSYRIGLSGTPIYNRGSEIWPIVDILRPGLLGNFKEFCEYFCYVNEKGKAIVLENKRQSLKNELQKHVMLRRKKSDVLKELKDKVRYKEVIDSDATYYYEELDKIWKKFEEEQKVAETAFDKSASYQRAIQSERQIAGVAKLPHVINFVKNIMEIEESVVVFCHHKAIHKLLHENLQEFSPVSIIGGQTDKFRQDQIDKFQRGDSKLMIAGLRAGNVGINLSKARYVIFAELDWSPAIHRQAEDRLHRIGQKDTVFAYYLIGNGTLDEHVANVLVDKSYEIDAIMDDIADNYENKEKAELIMAQIHDKVRMKLNA